MILDVRGLSNITDYYLLATGNSPPHIRALLDELERVLRPDGVRPYRRAGTPESQWVVADYFDVVVHVFTADARSYYDLDRLWGDAGKVK